MQAHSAPGTATEPTMTIVMIQGPDHGHGQVDAAMRDALSTRARAAGQSLVQLRCDSAQQLVERLARIDRDGADIILLDPGAFTRDGALRSTLEHLPVPYIEVHPGRHDRPAPRPAGGGRCVAVVDGYQTQGYTLAMSLALETLGCADCENEFNLGT
jgi:3-dehydroquinate dehydratase-1